MDSAIISLGYYDLSFIDWNNEWEHIASENPEQIQKLLQKEQQQKIKRIASKFLETKKIGTSNQTCSICLENYQKNQKIYQIKKCLHIFHTKCLEPWVLEY